MKTAILFSFSDIGKNKRFLDHARNLVSKKNFNVVLIGFDITDIPKEIHSISNISVRYIFPFNINSIFLQILLWPLQFLFYFIQLLSVTSNLSNISLIICSSNFYFTETFCGYLLSLIFQSSILIFDISSFTWYENKFSGFITKKMLTLSKFVICPTHEMEIVLKLRNLNCYFIPDIPDISFQSNKQSKTKICNVFNCDPSSIFIAVPILEFDNSIFTCLFESANYLKQSKQQIIFIIFGNGKSSWLFETKMHHIDIPNVSFRFIPFQYNLYPFTLGSCNLGIYFTDPKYVIDVSPCLLEMISCEIPIIAFKYGCNQSFVKDSRAGGLILDNENDLGRILKDIFVNHSISISELKNETKQNLFDQYEILWDKTFLKIV